MGSQVQELLACGCKTVKMVVMILPVLLLLLSSTPTHSCEHHSPPQILNTLDHTMLLHNNSLVLECLGEGEPEPSYHWFRNNQVMAEEVRVIEVREEGYYYCQAHNFHGIARSDIVHVMEEGRGGWKGQGSTPTWKNAPVSQKAREGSNVELMCEASGNPEPRVEWFKNGEVIEGETDNKLLLENIRESDVANYACNVSNSAGYLYKNVVITLTTGEANITSRPVSNLTVLQGSNITIPCQSSWAPNHTISWRVKGVKLGYSDRHTVDENTGALTIEYVQLDDEDTYNCFDDDHNEDKETTELIVKKRTEITHGPEDQVVTVFSPVLMNCTVVADMTQNLTVMWKKDGIELGLVGFSKSDRIDTDENYSLRIKNTSLADSGNYTCQASTDLSEESASAGLIVKGIPPLLAQPNWPADKIEGSNLTLSCPVLQGYPTPTISWYKDTYTLPTYGDTLHIPSLEFHHSGDYTCMASNNFGTDTVLIPLRVRKTSRVVSTPLTYQLGKVEHKVFNCEVEVDENLQESVVVTWYKGAEKLNISTLFNFDTEQGTDTDHLLAMLPNSSLLISGAGMFDVGEYSCEVVTRLEAGIRSYQGEIITLESQLLPLIIILVVILTITVLLLGVCLTCHKVGLYRVNTAKTPEEVSIIKKMNRFPTHSFSPSMKQSSLLTQMQMTQFPNINSSICSVGSLSSFDELLDSGMAEDGSFRGHYS